MRMAPMDSMITLQGMALFERIRRIKGCDLVRGNLSPVVGFDVSKVQTKPRVILPTYRLGHNS